MGLVGNFSNLSYDIKDIANKKRLKVNVMSAFSNWPLSAGSCRLDLHEKCFQVGGCSPLISHFMVTAAGFYRRAAGHFMRRVEHDEHLIGYVTSGHGYLQIGSTAERFHEVGPGSLWWIRPGVPHYYYAAPEKPWSVYWAHVQKSEANALFDLIGFQETPVLSVGIDQSMIQEFERLLINLNQQPCTNALLISVSARLRAWLCEAAVILEDHSKKPSAIIEHANRAFSQNIGKKFCLDGIAAEFNLSKFHFSRKYKRLTGKSPVTAFMEFKMNYACELLTNKNRSVEEIGYQIGFDDGAYFSKVFNKYIGLTPSKYRSNLGVIKNII